MLNEGRHSLWIMDRKGQAGEVYCADCGESLFCSRCGSVMRSENTDPEQNYGSSTLRCVKCGARTALPTRCPACRGTLLQGKRPGLEALLPWATRHLQGCDVRIDEADKKSEKGKKTSGPALILGTRGILSLCDTFDVGLVAWLDLDAESRKIEYNAQFQTYSMVWESYWRGLRRNSANGERTVLVQTRRPSSAWHSSFWLGWEHFWKGELEDRKNLNLPPYTMLVQVDLPNGENPDDLTELLMKANIFATNAGASPLWVTVKSTDRLRAALGSRFEIRHSRRGFPVVTVWTE
jgi:primosomal protein N' (replication factor Y)